MKKAKPQKRTKNPAFQMFGKVPDYIPAGSVLKIDIQNSPLDDLPGMAGIAADLMIRAALVGASENEKLLIAATIPIFLKAIRPKKKSDKPSKTSVSNGPRTTKPPKPTEAKA